MKFLCFTSTSAACPFSSSSRTSRNLDQLETDSNSPATKERLMISLFTLEMTFHGGPLGSFNSPLLVCLSCSVTRAILISNRAWSRYLENTFLVRIFFVNCITTLNSSSRLKLRQLWYWPSSSTSCSFSDSESWSSSRPIGGHQLSSSTSFSTLSSSPKWLRSTWSGTRRYFHGEEILPSTNNTDRRATMKVRESSDKTLIPLLRPSNPALHR